VSAAQDVPHPVTILTAPQIWLNLGGLVLLMVLMGLAYWLHTGTRAVPGLIEDLQSQDLQAQMLAAQWLAKLGLDAQPAVPMLVDQALNHPNRDMKVAATRALRILDLQASRKVMEDSIHALGDSDANVRRSACGILGSLGLLAKPAVPSLIGMLADEDDLVRAEAVGALGAIGVPLVDISTALTTALFDRASAVRYRAASLFAFTVPIPTTAIAALSNLQKDSDKSVASLARVALDRGGGVDRSDVQILISLLQGRGEKNDTLQRLARLGPPAAEAVPALSAVLNDPLPLNRYLAAEALGTIGAAAKQSIPVLQRTLHDTDPIVRDAATEALHLIETATGGKS
jgi:HEAT repeat protein